MHRSSDTQAASPAELSREPSQLDLFAAEPRAGCLSIRRSRRAKRLQVRVFPHGHAEVIVPERARRADVVAFIADSRDWIERTRRRAMDSGAASDLSLPRRVVLPSAGETWRISYTSASASGERLRVERCESAGGSLTVGAGEPRARDLLRRWLAERARRVLSARVQALADATGLQPTGVSIRRQRTRWGSCTASGRINLNCAALFLPGSLVEYLIVHELCHLRHMNHSGRFWKLVASFVPDYRQRESELAEAWNIVPGWVFYDP